MSTIKTKSLTQMGMTLIELMIAILLAAIVIGATMGFLFSSVKSSSENIKMTRMNQELRAVMSFMLDELRRSGYTSEPTDSGMMDVLNWNDTDDCLSFAYLSNASTATPTANTRSFKLNGDVILFSDDPGTVCGGDAINDADTVKIDSFEVEPTTFTSATFATFLNVSIPRLKITIEGHVDGIPSASRTITDIVRLRNEAPN